MQFRSCALRSSTALRLRPEVAPASYLQPAQSVARLCSSPVPIGCREPDLTHVPRGPSVSVSHLCGIASLTLRYSLAVFLSSVQALSVAGCARPSYAETVRFAVSSQVWRTGWGPRRRSTARSSTSDWRKAVARAVDVVRIESRSRDRRVRLPRVPEQQAKAYHTPAPRRSEARTLRRARGTRRLVPLGRSARATHRNETREDDTLVYVELPRLLHRIFSCAAGGIPETITSWWSSEIAAEPGVRGE